MSSARVGAQAVEVLVVNSVVPPFPARVGAQAVEVLINMAGVEPATSPTGVTMFRR
jgi:hypothetical protein